MQYNQVTDILGGEKVLGRRISSRADLVELGRTGLRKNALSNLVKYMSLSWRDMASLLPVSERTVQRYQKYGAARHLNQQVSEQTLQLAEIMAMGSEVFGDRDNFLAWLSMSSVALGNEKPMELLGSRFGAEMVMDELGRIAHGIPA